MKQGRRVRFAGRGHGRSWWLLFAAALAAVLWAIAQVLGWPLWARAVLAGLAAAVPLIVAELQAWLRQRDTRAQLVEQGVVVSGGRGLLPRVRDVGLDQLRAHAAQVKVPYIERDQQAKLEDAVGPKRAALVVGHSMSGKTRLAAEVVKRKFPDAPRLAAESGKALRELFDGGLDPEGIVVWLDDLERFLGADGLTLGLFYLLSPMHLPSPFRAFTCLQRLSALLTYQSLAGFSLGCGAGLRRLLDHARSQPSELFIHRLFNLGQRRFRVRHSPLRYSGEDFLSLFFPTRL